MIEDAAFNTEDPRTLLPEPPGEQQRGQQAQGEQGGMPWQQQGVAGQQQQQGRSLWGPPAGATAGAVGRRGPASVPRATCCRPYLDECLGVCQHLWWLAAIMSQRQRMCHTKQVSNCG